MVDTDAPLAGSFRDPSGFLFERDGMLYRQVNERYHPDYDCLIGSGLYDALIDEGALIPHTEVDAAPLAPGTAYKILEPERVPFVSYPYEWGFGQLRDAATLTLRIERTALAHGMTLKDASAYNVQFADGRPVFIDTLSFERYEEGRPWVAYRQFCQHFLAPLALMAHSDVRLGTLLRVHLDGIPLDLASRLLPARTRLRPALMAHLHLHARTQRRYADRPEAARGRRMSHRARLGLIDHLLAAIGKLRPAEDRDRGAWADYDASESYADEALQHKTQIVSSYLHQIAPSDVWDLGANVGTFSRVAAEAGARVVAFDVDPIAVERHYRRCLEDGETRVLPLWLDLANPSPALGWAHRERDSLLDRGPADAVLALALVHHLAIGHNVPLDRLADVFSAMGRALIVEFVPKTDPQTKRLLAAREDVFDDYTRAEFERAFRERFTIEESTPLRGSERVLYRMSRR